MKTLDRYILRQLIFITALGVLSLTLLMLLGQLFKELHSLLVESGAPPSIVFDFIIRVIPFSLTFSVPWGFLTAVLLVYGRLAADNELTGMRMAGLSLARLSAPAIGLGLALSALCYYINIEVAPRSKQAVSELAITSALNNPRNLLNSGQSATKLDRVQLYIEARDGDELRGLHIYPSTDEDELNPGGGFSSVHARSARIGDFDAKTRMLELTLEDAVIERTRGGSTDLPRIGRMPLKVHIPIRTRRKLKSNRFTNAEINEVLRHQSVTRTVQNIDLGRYARAAALHPTFPCADRLWAEAIKDAHYYNLDMNEKDERSFRTEGTQRASFACACFVFSLLGVPLAITARRKDTSTGFAIGIMVASLYFLALVLCEMSRKSGGITPYIVLWLPNVLCVAFALWEHRKATFRG